MIWTPRAQALAVAEASVRRWGLMIAPNSWTKPPSGISPSRPIKLFDGDVRFEVIPRRWVVERTFAWMTRWRRLVRDYEERIDCSEAMIHVALGSVCSGE